MSKESRAVLIEQNTTINSIQRVLINFKKLAKAQITLHKTKGRLSTLETLWERCQTLHVQLMQLVTPEEEKSFPYLANQEFLNAEEAYYEAADHLQDVIGRFDAGDSGTLPKVNESLSRDTTAGISLHLPRIALPSFAGQFTEWENFRSIFESLVANNASLSPTQKLHYLKSSITGEAAFLINNIQVSDANYEAAWRLLLDEYDNKDAIIQAHLHAFMDQLVMRSENVSELKKLRDTVSASIAALHNLGRPVSHWDDIVVYIISQKFSSRTRHEWNLRRGDSDAYPTYKEIHDFMTLRIRGLTDYNSSRGCVPATSRVNKVHSAVHTVSAANCAKCSGEHVLAKCEEFVNKPVDVRTQLAKQYKCCFNCLRPGHYPRNCPSKGRCSRCRRAHHTLLHRSSGETMHGAKDVCPSSNLSTTISASINKSSVDGDKAIAAVNFTNTVAPAPTSVLLATVWALLRTPEGREFKLRALLDQGSTCSFISESLCQTMRTKRYRADLKIHGFGEKYSGVAKHSVHLVLMPCDKSGPAFPLTCYAYQKITSYTASLARLAVQWPHLRYLSLADPDPSSRDPIHVLIGADLYGSVLLNDLRKGPPGTPTAQLTIFGWILSGPTGTDESPARDIPSLHCVACLDTSSVLRQFWEDESVPSVCSLNEEDERCKEHFIATHSRTRDGRYIVRLPFKGDSGFNLGETRSIAFSLYSKLERRLSLRPKVAAQYQDFLHEYEALGHMQRVDSRQIQCPSAVYIPHHFVLREYSATTKLRVVFNASCQSSNEKTLNDFLMAGPKLQQDISAILSRWRQFRYVYTADIEKMFRQILMHPDDADFQQILWRPSDESSVHHYHLLTVTYGLAPAPYLALRVLRQLALDEGSAFPAAVPIFENSIYVDDTLFGADDLATLKETRDQVIGLMRRGGFRLRKWTANSVDLLNDIPCAQQDSKDHFLAKDDTLKVLGLV